MEFYTYVIFSLGALLFGTSKLPAYAAISLISLALLATGNDHGFELLLKCFTGFVLGCLIAALTKTNRFQVPGYFSAAFALMLVAFICLKKDTGYDWLIFLPTAGLIYSVAGMARNRGRGILTHRFFVWLGTISYSLYMCHSFVIWIVQQSVRVLLKRPETRDMFGNLTPQLSTAEAVIGLIVIFAAVIATSTVVHHLIEYPMREGSRRLADRLFAPPTQANRGRSGH